MSSPPDVNPSAFDLRAAMARTVAIRKAMHLLAKLDHDRKRLPFHSFKALSVDDQAWYEQVAEQLFNEAVGETLDRELERRAAARLTARSAAILQERQRARLQACERGHELGAWGCVPDRLDETAACTRCHRVAVIVVADRPALEIRLEGSALTEGCLSLTEKGQRADRAEGVS